MGAGPAGSTTAFHLAQAGRDVLLLEKTAFPREKVCGDGLTPRAVKELLLMGISTSTDAGWLRNRGLRIVGGNQRFTLPWPDLASFPDYGLVSKRSEFDELLARTAEKAGARLHENTTVTGPVLDDAGRIDGVLTKSGRTYRAPLVIAADGNSSRLALAMGLTKRDDRPMGVAVRTYYTSPRHDDDWLESWLELWATDAKGNRSLLPGLRLDLRSWRRHVQRRAGHPQHLERVRRGRLQGPAQTLARRDARGMGLPRGQSHRADSRRRPSDGIQPPAALPPRTDARGRRRRHGQSR